VQQAVTNFASNAIKFTEKGSITLHARVIEELADTVLIRFEVEDTGIGIAPDILPRLFTSFQQADNSSTRIYGGTGLGLAITRNLAQLMGGDAGATSTRGVGSTFWFTARFRTVGSVQTETGSSLSGDAETVLKRDHAGRRILLVEDEPINAEVSRMLLEDAGLRVEHAADGIAAVAMAGQNSYDLILMDMQMPRMDGIAATRAIRALPGYATTPILAMTANAFVDDKLRCQEAGMNDFITKPVSPGVLYETLLKWLAHASAPPAR
jgi:two-component system sensor histidine kinase/response regulator